MPMPKTTNVDDKIDHTYFAELLDDPGKFILIELMAEDPHFWSTASSWIKAANDAFGDPRYALDETRLSTLMSLLTARPENPDCQSKYESYGNSIHDMMVHGMKVALNAKRQQARAWDNIMIELPKNSIEQTHGPELAVFEQMWAPTEADAFSFLGHIQNQVAQNNEWELDKKTLSGLLHMAAHGQFPTALLDDSQRFVKPGSIHPDITYKMAKDPESTLSTLLSIVMHPKVMQAALKEKLEARLIPVIDPANLSASQMISIALKDSSVLSHVKGDWDSIHTLAIQELLAQIRPTHGLSGHQPKPDSHMGDKKQFEDNDNLTR